MQYLDTYAMYQDNLLPVAKETAPGAERYQNMTTVGMHYRMNYYVPYWDPEGGFWLDADYEGGEVDLQGTRMINKLSAQLSTVAYFPDLLPYVGGIPWVQEWLGPALRWWADNRLAVRAYGATSAPQRGEFFTLGGSMLFRGFDLAERQGSTAWVGSVEWRAPLARGLTWDLCDHILGVRNVYGAAFYDVGEIYANGHQVGPIAQALGAGLRVDVAWFGFVERSMLRIDVARTINSERSYQVWFGIQQPF
jgi:hypothetical protein